MTRTATLLAFSTLLLAQANAQVVLQSTDVANATLQLGIVLGVSAPADGANVTWDVSSTPFNILGTATLGPAAGTPYASQFPNATRSAYNVVPGFSTYYTYWRSTSTSFEIVADGVGSGQDQTYSDPLQLLQFPFNYQASFTDSYNSPGFNSGDETWTYSGYGTLITSVGTFHNVVKVHDQFNDRVIFWNKTPLYPIMDIDGDGDGTVMAAASVGLDEQAAAPALTCFPNPVADQLTVSGMKAGDNYLITDALGRMVSATQPVLADAPFTVDVSALTPGMYFLRVQGVGTQATRPFVKQ